MSDWPTMCPPDLRARLTPALEGYRTRPQAAEVWTEVRAWLEEQGVEAPDELPTDQCS